ncbi:hypothetical protein BH11MYX3_BH11MYX3_34840 [soil metagenome]
MQRVIAGFHQDPAEDWVADLICGHGQHVRHKPPFWSRPWVLTPDGRTSRLGLPLDCVLCDRFEVPAGFAAYKRTADFDETSIPAGLLKDHSTKAGVWGVIHVLAGRLSYLVEPPLARELVLDATAPGIVVPEVLHRVAPLGTVTFFVEFHRRSS